MKSSTKVRSLTKTIGMENEDLLADVRDARSVVDVATKAWTEENEQTAAACVGVLQLIDYKLSLIECALQGINGMDHTIEGRS